VKGSGAEGRASRGELRILGMGFTTRMRIFAADILQLKSDSSKSEELRQRNNINALANIFQSLRCSQTDAVNDMI